MPKLPQDRLTESEWGILKMYAQELQLLQTQISLIQRAANHIMGLALESRGVSHDGHKVNLETGVIEVKDAQPRPS